MLHPQYSLRWFEKNWKGNFAKYLKKTKDAMRDVYDTQFKKDADTSIDEDAGKKKNFLTTFRQRTLPNKVKDEYKDYAGGDPMPTTPTDLIKWWMHKPRSLPRARWPSTT